MELECLIGRVKGESRLRVGRGGCTLIGPSTSLLSEFEMGSVEQLSRDVVDETLIK